MQLFILVKWNEKSDFIQKNEMDRRSDSMSDGFSYFFCFCRRFNFTGMLKMGDGIYGYIVSHYSALFLASNCFGKICWKINDKCIGLCRSFSDGYLFVEDLANGKESS